MKSQIPGFETAAQAGKRCRRGRNWVTQQCSKNYWLGAVQIYPGGPWLVPAHSMPIPGCFVRKNRKMKSQYTGRDERSGRRKAA